MTTYGTSHFRSKFAAIRYYETFGYEREDVMRKLAEGEIAIGPPALKPGETLRFMEGGRYAISGSANNSWQRHNRMGRQ